MKKLLFILVFIPFIGFSQTSGCMDPAACNYDSLATVSAIQEHTTNKEHLKVTDLLGRETKDSKDEVIFYIYDDGTVEKRIVIE